MTRIEELLRRAPLRASPPALDERVRAALDAAASAQPSVALLPVPLWACAAACLFCALFGFAGGLLARLEKRSGEWPAVVCYVEPSPGIGRLLRGVTPDDGSSIAEQTLTFRAVSAGPVDDSAPVLPKAPEAERSPVE